MDCTPPAGAEVLLPTSQAPAAMEVEVQPPQPLQPSGVPMEIEAPRSPAPRRQQRRRAPIAAADMECDPPARFQESGRAHRETTAQQRASPPPLELSGVPSTRIEDCLAWLAGHTPFDVAESRAALCTLYSQQPIVLLSGDTATERDAMHTSLCEILREAHGADSLPEDCYGLPPITAADMMEPAEEPAAASPAHRQGRPVVPPGFEQRARSTSAARQAAAAALAGLPGCRHSGRVSHPPTKWWEQQRQQQQHRRSTGGAQEQEQDGGPAGKAALPAMNRCRQPSLRLLSHNVNGLRDKDKRRCLFNLLERDK